MKEQYLLAVDGGATKTTLSLRTHSGNTLFEKTTTGSNYQTIGAEQVEKVLSNLLIESYQSTNISNIDIAVFGLAGIDTEYDLSVVKQIVEKCIRKASFLINKVIVENDVHGCLLGLTGYHPGALIISGTGAIALAHNGNGTVVRTGGWGHRAGDEGSGYWIGKEILKSIFRLEDGRDVEPTVLKELVYQKLDIQNVEQLMTWLYHPEYTNAQIASLSLVISEAISLGDEQAITIALHAANELSILAMTTLQKIGYEDGPFPLYLNGGIFKHHAIITSLFKERILEKSPNIMFTLCTDNPIEYIVNRALQIKESSS